MSVLAADGSVGVYVLKTHLSAVLDEVAAGREVTVPRHGHAIARLAPVAGPTREQRREAVERIREFARTVKPLPAGVTVEDLYQQGRR